MKSRSLIIGLLFLSIPTFASEKKPLAVAPTAVDTATKGPFKPYAKVITDKAITQKGLFKVHKVEDKYYFEIPDSLLGREMMMTSRFSKIAGGGGVYAGEKDNEQTVVFEKGINKNILLRVVTVLSVADSTTDIIKAVKNSNLNPIVANFEIKTIAKDSSASVIDVTDFFKGDNLPVSLSVMNKKRLNLSAQLSDRTYIHHISSFPLNTEIRVVRTFSSTPSFGPSMPSPFPSTTLPAAYAAGAVTLEMNNSFVLLPKVPMKKRLFDDRVGFFADEFSVFTDDQQKVDNQVFIVRWRLEPKPEDVEKYKKGILVEPKKQIVYYIDPATPKKWRPYLMQGVNDWQAAFEQAGFKNAIVAKEWPENDSTMNLEDARYSVMRYLPSDIANAYGPNVHDPRSGEIIESHIGWYHNVMKLVHDWYMIQASSIDSQARTMEFNDELMGQLIRFVSSHEVGHTLGLRHNMGSSSKTPVEKLRDKNWVEANGHTASIMDYARFNYVAQPEDHISQKGIFPRIGAYDKWAIQWGYTYLPVADEQADKKIVNKWIIDSLKANPRLWFGTETNPFDPRSQTEDLSDDNVVASEYGIKNMKRLAANLINWTKEEAGHYENLQTMYTAMLGQFNRYMNHVLRNIGGIYETPKSEEQAGDIYEPTPKVKQVAALQFLNKQLFTTPTWLLDKSILNKITMPLGNENVNTIQINVLNSLIAPARLNRIAASANRFNLAASDYLSIDELLKEVLKTLTVEMNTHASADLYRRNLQRAFVETLSSTIDLKSPNAASVKNTDAFTFSKIALQRFRTQIQANIPLTSDATTKYHYQDLSDKIKQALDPK
ncbi:MAG: hypothetical protein RLZ39_156 [Bacteroidota bacterium]|jgi:hypothetical protein